MIARTPPQEVLHSESRLATGSRSSKRIRRLLVGIEVAVSVALVLMTGLLTTSLLRLLHADRGFETARITTAMVDLPTKSYAETEARTVFYKHVLDRLSHLPGVEHAAPVSQLPLSGDTWIDMIRIPGETRPVVEASWACKSVLTLLRSVLAAVLSRGQVFEERGHVLGHVIQADRVAGLRLQISDVLCEEIRRVAIGAAVGSGSGADIGRFGWTGLTRGQTACH